MNNYIKGKITKIIYENNTNGYYVLLFKVNNSSKEYEEYKNKSIKVTGYFNNINTYDNYNLYGEFFSHYKYGDTFRVDKLEVEEKTEENSIVDFLSSDLFEGIGESKAKLIYDKLKDKTFEIIINNPNNLLLIDGITKKNIETLHDTLLEYETSYKTIIRLNELGFSQHESMIIYKKYKSNTLNIIDEDIYSLRRNIYNITFDKVDRAAKNLNKQPNDIIRIRDIICYIIEIVTFEFGNDYLLIDELKYEVLTRYNELNEEDFIKGLNSALEEKLIIKNDEKYFIKEVYDSYKLICSRFKMLSHKKDNTKEYNKIQKELKIIEKNLDIDYNKEQEMAITNSIYKDITIITGGPGTGKTTILKAICELYKIHYKIDDNTFIKEVALLAPTGRAAKRMSNITNYQASTIHSFLKWNKDTNLFQINEYNRSHVKLVILDETSMIDIYLMGNLLKGLITTCKFVIIGDYHQLPSVGPGDVLRDLIESNIFNCIYLKQLYRQDKDSNLLSLAYNIRDNYLDESLFNKNIDLNYIKCRNDEIINNICEVYKNINNPNYQILVPMYATTNGIDNINTFFQDNFNPNEILKNETKIGGITYREKDKIIQLNNMPDSNIYNGDIGTIERIEYDPIRLTANFDGIEVTYTKNMFNNFKLAYSISIHKAQGSEFDIVILPMTMDYRRMLYKRLIYTAITRAKHQLYIIGDIEALKYAINNDSSNRRTALVELLKGK